MGNAATLSCQYDLEQVSKRQRILNQKTKTKTKDLLHCKQKKKIPFLHWTSLNTLSVKGERIKAKMKTKLF